MESRWSYEEIPLLAQQFERRMSHAHGQESPALEASDLLFQPGRAKIIGSKAEWASLNSQFRQAHCMGNHRHNSRNRDRTGCSQQLKLRHYRKTAQPADPSQKDAQDFTCRLPLGVASLTRHTGSTSRSLAKRSGFRLRAKSPAKRLNLTATDTVA